MGTDIPDLSAAVMTAALVALDASQLVLGPARDGGFYLIGAATPVPADLMAVSQPQVARSGALPIPTTSEHTASVKGLFEPGKRDESQWR